MTSIYNMHLSLADYINIFASCVALVSACMAIRKLRKDLRK